MAGKRRPETPATPEGKTGRRLRWAVAIALVVGAHLLVWVGLVRMPGPALPLAPDLPVLEAILVPPQPVAVPPPRPRPPPKATRPAPPAPAPEPDAAPPLATSEGGDTTTAAGSGGEGTAPAAPPGPPAAPAAGAPQEPAAPALRYAAPPSTTLRYASFVNGVQNPDGNIQWEQGGGRYRLSVEMRMLWFRFAFRSEGALDERGLAPERYEEERRKRKQAVRFDRAARTLVFEAAGRQEPLPEGVQDRFSVFLQLVGLVRGNPQRYATPGVTETFQVADTRDLEPMRVQYVGEEEVDTGNGFVRARHFIRLPRRADDHRRVEVWLAEAVGWMPVKLRQTEPDGTQIDLILRGG
ncbi:DUF3108 domain-containing protein [Cupriavidus respiraculi]|uniref:DUF3108 domain-containing protein n=2 Tax=Cupriavidus respiraculi TaxID=195930 RepID=A0ABN7Z9M4_9BURK|nr:DUF3108 domain-containing protein [Cupriavidus respiraculi]CAG9181953.1 hypothetical protein LMG21510_04434 [Cupriavidus respiraculi]